MIQNGAKWNKIVQCENFNFNDFPIATKSCINHFQLDVKQEATFNIICSSFMLSYLYDQTITQFGNVEDKKKARQALLKKGGLDILVMNLSGSGGSGKSFVLNASKSLCQQFCKVIGKPFSDSVFIVTATTITAAAQIQGDTVHLIAGLRKYFTVSNHEWN